MANGVARALLRRGLERGERVAILSANRAEYLAAYFGIMRAGLVAVPVNFKFPRQTIHFIIRDAGAKLVFCDRPRRADCPPDIPVVHFGDEGADGFDRFLDPGPFDADRAGARMSRRCSSTRRARPGAPKGVVLSHQSHLWVVETRPRRPGPVPSPLSDRRAALPHERAGAQPSSPARRTPPSCCCRSSPRTPISRRSSAIAAPGSPPCRR